MDDMLVEDHTDPKTFTPHFKFLRSSKIQFNSPEWWACLVHEKIRNYEMARTRHHTDMGKIPDDPSSLPIFTDPKTPEKQNDDCDDAMGAAESSDDSDEPTVKVFGDEDHVDREGKGVSRAGRVAAIVDVPCGQLPHGTALQDYHLPPMKVNARNMESLYWKKFGEQMSMVCKDEHENATPQAALQNDCSWHIDSVEALRAVEQQKKFFKAIDSFKIETLNGAAMMSSTAKMAVDPFDRVINASMAKLPQNYTWTPTVVIEAAIHLLNDGMLNVPDVGCINVKQARAFLWNAAWLQEYKNRIKAEEGGDVVCRLEKSTSEFIDVDNFHLVIIGAGGTGKTAVLKLTEALISYFAGVDTVKKLAPSNAAARLLGGDTIHALCKLPFGNVRLTCKKGRLTKGKLCAHRRAWMSTIAAFLDEVSMISADQFHQCDVRMRQAKQNPDHQFGGLALNICGDFLQLPPVDKDNTRRSLAMPYEEDSRSSSQPEQWGNDEEATAEADDLQDDVAIKKKKRKQEKAAENWQGSRIWRTIKKVVCLDINVRAPNALGRLQEEMRSGKISDEMWDLYMSRVLTESDARLQQSPFSDNCVHYVVHRHRIRVMRSLEQAKDQSRKLKTPLYVIQCQDVAVQAEDAQKLTDQVRGDLLRRVNPENTKGLPSFLPLYRGMSFLLSSKDCVRLGIMKGCPVILRDIVFARDEVLPSDPVAGHAHHLKFMPQTLILQAESVDWTLPEDELPGDLPPHIERKGLFQIRPSIDYLRVGIGNEYISVRRTSFLLTPADTITVYTAQGGTYDAIVADMQRPPNLNLAHHWLACYVMISRARSLEGFLVLRPATRKELSAKPPKYLLDELDRLISIENKSHRELVKYIESLSIDLPPSIKELLSEDAAREQVQQVKMARVHKKSSTVAKTVATPPSATIEGNATPPPPKKKRIFGKTSPAKIPIVASSKESLQCTSSKKRTVQAAANSGNSDEKRAKTSGGAMANSGNSCGSGSSNNAESDEKQPKTCEGATANSGNNCGSSSSNNAETLFLFKPIQKMSLEQKPRPLRNTKDEKWRESNAGSCFINAALQALFGSQRIRDAMHQHLASYFPAADPVVESRIMKLWKHCCEATQITEMHTNKKLYDNRPDPKDSIASSLRTITETAITDADVLSFTYAAVSSHDSKRNQGRWLLPVLVLRRFYEGSQDDSSSIIMEFITTVKFLRELTNGRSAPHQVICRTCNHVMDGHATDDELSWTCLKITGVSEDGLHKHNTIQEALDASLATVVPLDESYTRNSQGCANVNCRSMRGFNKKSGPILQAPPVLVILLEGWRLYDSSLQKYTRMHTDLHDIHQIKLLDRKYRLSSLTLHGQSSTPFCGHYVALVKHGHPSSWYLYNDDYRVQIAETTVACNFVHHNLDGVFCANVLIYECDITDEN